jgi:hypothetical protein
MATKNWAWAALPLLLIVVGLCTVPGNWPNLRGWTFVGVVALLAIDLVIVGYLVNGRPAGAFIDNRNRLSLSKLQAAAWTVIVLAAFATAAASNAVAPGVDYNQVQALAVTIPGELLLAMGISATSLVAAPALLSLKADEDPDGDTADAATARMGVSMVANGKLANKAAPAQASWADLVTGEEVGNVGTPDLGKIQQVLITLILLGAYAGYVFENFSLVRGVIGSLPQLDKSFVWLLGISHASYLAYKAAPHTKSADA